MEKFAVEILDVLDGLPVSVAALRRSGIGKTVFKLRSKRKDGEGPAYHESLRQVPCARKFKLRRSPRRPCPRQLLQMARCTVIGP